MSEDKPKQFPIPRPAVLVPVALVLVVIALWLSVWMPYHREQVVIREIERLGGSVGYDRGGPDWLRDLVGDEWMVGFDRVEYVRFRDGPITDDGLKNLGGLTNLTRFELSYTQVGDDGLKHLSGLTNLKGLWLNGTQVTDDGLKCLSGLTNLQVLGLNNTQVTDDGLKHLSGLANLKTLRLNGTQVTNEGVQSLKEKLPHCYIEWQRE